MSKVPFWMNPCVIAIAWMLVVLLTAACSDSLFMAIIGSNNYIQIDDVFVLLSCFFSFGFCSFLGFRIGKKEEMSDDNDSKFSLVLANGLMIQTIAVFLFLILFSYFIWFYPMISSGIWLKIITGEIYGRAAIASVATTIPGVTTMTQFGIPVAIVSAYAILLGTDLSKRVFRFYLIALVMVSALSAFRALLWSERLALFEVLIPVGIVFFIVKYRGQIWCRLFPIVGLISIIILFGCFEYSRSWRYYKESYSNIATYSFSRFGSYYLSSFNNMAMVRDHMTPVNEPINSLGFAYKLPIPGLSWLNEDKAENWNKYEATLNHYANPELNLYSAVGAVINDFGDYGGCAVLSIFGLISGILYRSACSQGRAGLLFFPFWCTGLFEMGRLLYWPAARAFPAIAATIVLLWVMDVITRKRLASETRDLSTLKNRPFNLN